jgi:bla regulator protein BlaR1
MVLLRSEGTAPITSFFSNLTRNPLRFPKSSHNQEDMGMDCIIRSITVILITGGLVASQTKPSFDVASIKSGNSKDARSWGVHIQPGGLFRCENTTLKQLISFAYDLKNYEILSGPTWVDSAVFTIEARAPDPSARDRNDQTQMKSRIQSLLEDRFHLASHFETRQEPVYELVIAKNGQKMRASPKTATDSGLAPRPGHVIAKNVALSQLARSLSLQLGRTILDKTGLTEKYDFELIYTPEARDGIFGELLPPESLAAVDPAAPSIFTALQEQLGLRLESAKAPLSILIIDSAEKPSEN